MAAIRRMLRAAYHRHVKWRYVRHRLLRQKGVFDLEFYGEGIGFFAQMTACLQFFRHARAQGFTPYVRLTSHNYVDSGRGDDWFAYYFDHRTPRPAGPSRPALRIGNIGEMPEFEHDLSLEDARALFFEHVRIKPAILGAVAEFCRANRVGRSTLGIHYRGTDKVQEAKALTYVEMHDVIDRVLRRNAGFDSVFVASDEQAFIDDIGARFGHVRVVTFDDSVRSRDDQPVHLGGRAAGNYLLGLDAMMNALILAECGTLLRSTSFLSAWSSVFSPGLPVLLVNAPYAHKMWYPEREIMKTATLARTLLD